MKAKRILWVIAAAILVILALVFFLPRTSSDLKQIQTADIQEMTVYRPAGQYTVTGREDMEQVLEQLREMRLRSAFPNTKDGMFAEIEMSLEKGRVLDVSILGKHVRINGKYYRASKDPCPELEQVLSGLEQTYENIEN